GSSPRPVGSVMALRSDGAVVGSVSGGCIEDDLIRRFAIPHGNDPIEPMSGPPRLLSYGIGADEAHRFGLPCGGTLELLLDFNPRADELGDVLALLRLGVLIERRVDMADGTATHRASATPQALRLTSIEMLARFGPEYRMLLIGGGQMSEYLATMALFNGFQVFISDPRDEHLVSWSVDGAMLMRGVMPDDAVAAFKPDRRSCVIALTHDPKLDDLALLAALETNAFYVGAIGSRRNSDARRRRMREHFGVEEGTLARHHAPIGIFIGSKTPPEIAESVMAEVIACRNAVPLPHTMRVQVAKDESEAMGRERVLPGAAALAGYSA
ncbi:XdhC family protein, partial [Roseateles sp. P5_E11]